jgi:hypothetical protein
MATKPLGKRDAARRFPIAVIQELDQLEADLGGRQQLIGLLSLAPLNDDLRYIIGLLSMPKTTNHDSQKLADICAAGNILPGELLKHLGAAALLRGKTLALQHIGNGIAAVAHDVMRRSAPYEEPCYTCAGIGTVVPEPTKDLPNPVPGPCETCKGCGRLVHMPDLARQEVAIEMAQLLPKGGGLQILNQQITAGGTGGSAGMGTLEKLQLMTDKILYGIEAPIDAEILEDAGTEDPVEGGGTSPAAPAE